MELTIRPARRPSMHARLLLSGPPGSGKTWTALSIASVLARGEMSHVLCIDTEAGSALTYADLWPGFGHASWPPPYDPSALAQFLSDLDAKQWHVVIIDSLSHWWRGPGGTLDLSDGRFGGWRTARPVQDRLLSALLHVRAHLIACTRAKQAYAVEDDGRTIRRLGMEPIQDDSLPYEMQVVVELDVDHLGVVSKSRCPALPVGTRIAPHEEGKFARAYADWLAGGVAAAPAEVIDTITSMFASLPDDERKRAKQEFVRRFGMPSCLTNDRASEALDWISEYVSGSALT